MGQPHDKQILIVGAGIAGPSLAYWLVRRGFEVTLAERSPVFRTGGYMIDFWGLGYDVAERMHLIAPMRAAGYEIEELRFVNAAGRRTSSIGGRAFRDALGDRFFSILRGDLARVIFDRVASEVETIFGDGVVAVAHGASSADVTFDSGRQRSFHLVVGADGLHSTVRGAIFGAEERFEQYLGYHCASFAVDSYPYRDEGVYVSYAEPGRQVSRYALRGGGAAFLFVFAEPSKLSIDSHDVVAQKAFLRARFGRDGWECSQILERLDCVDELYFDGVKQIRMPQWRRGRVALVGDAAYCPSLLAGEGSGLAMAGAYLLAAELARVAGDYRQACAAYESRFRSFIRDKQKSAARFAGQFAPGTRLGLRLRDCAIRLMSLPKLGPVLLRRVMRDDLDLPDYHAVNAPH